MPQLITNPPASVSLDRLAASQYAVSAVLSVGFLRGHRRGPGLVGAVIFRVAGECQIGLICPQSSGEIATGAAQITAATCAPHHGRQSREVIALSPTGSSASPPRTDSAVAIQPELGMRNGPLAMGLRSGFAVGRGPLRGCGCGWEPGSAGEEHGEGVEGVDAPFGGGGQVGRDDGEVGEAEGRGRGGCARCRRRCAAGL
jgi:hypothetical protein